MREYTAKEEGYVFMLCRCWCLCEGLSIRSPTTILKLTCYQLSSCRLVNQHTCLPHNTNLGEGRKVSKKMLLKATNINQGKKIFNLSFAITNIMSFSLRTNVSPLRGSALCLMVFYNPVIPSGLVKEAVSKVVLSSRTCSAIPNLAVLNGIPAQGRNDNT